MKCCDPFLFIRNNTALFLRTDTYFHKCMPDVCLLQIHTPFFSSRDRCFIQQIFQIRAGKSSRCLGNLLQIHILRKWFSFRMDLKDLKSSLHIRSSNDHFSVKPPRAKNGRIQNIHTVRRSHNNNSLIRSKAIHLYQKLVQCLLSLIMASAHTCSAASCHRINLINKYNTGRIVFRILKEISHTGCSNSDKHLHKIGTGNREKRDPGFTSHRSCK